MHVGHLMTGALTRLYAPSKDSRQRHQHCRSGPGNLRAPTSHRHMQPVRFDHNQQRMRISPKHPHAATNATGAEWWCASRSNPTTSSSAIRHRPCRATHLTSSFEAHVRHTQGIASLTPVTPGCGRLRPCVLYRSPNAHLLFATTHMLCVPPEGTHTKGLRLKAWGTNHKRREPNPSGLQVQPRLCTCVLSYNALTHR